MDVSHVLFPAVLREIPLPESRSGFTLIEVLITLLILAIGLLGSAALQIQGLRYTHEAVLRTQAMTFATDMVERIRANRNASSPGPTSEEIKEWTAHIADRLPEGDGRVIRMGSSLSVDVFWQAPDASHTSSLSITP